MTSLAPSLPGRTRLALFVLSAAYFFIGATSIGIIGMLAEMSAGLDVSTSAIAGLITVFAIVYAVAAPGLQAIVGGFPRRSLIATGVSLMAASCFLSALAPGYWAVAASRVGMAIGAALTGPTVSAAAAALVPPERRAQALAAVFSGLTVSTVLGIPVSSFLAQTIGWRWAWTAVGLAAICVVPLVLIVLDGANRGQRATLGAFAACLRNRALVLTVSTTALQIGGQFTTYALLAAWIVEYLKLSHTLVPPLLFVFGVAGVAGNALSSTVERRLGAERTVQAGLLVAAGALLLMAVTPPYVVTAFLLASIWSASGLLIMAPLQTRLVGLAPEIANLSLALNASAIYVGMSVGSALAALVYTWFGVGDLPLVSVAVLGLAYAAFRFSLVSR